MPVSPADEYRGRVETRRATVAARDRLDEQLSHARLVTFAVAALIALLAWRGVAPWWLLFLPAILFLWLVRHHDRILRTRDRALRAVRLYEHGLARIEDRWDDIGEPGDRFRDDDHIYANDLDLFGRGSLFQLLSLARTRAGEDTLAGWLTSQADAGEIGARQQAVDELAPALDVRENLALAGADVRASVDTDRLLQWAETPLPPSGALRAVTWICTAAMLAGVGYVVATGVWAPLGGLLIAQTVAFRRFRDQINRIVSARDPEAGADFVADALTHRARDLSVLGDLIQVLESAPFQCQRVAALRRQLQDGAVSASRVIARLRRLAMLHDSERNALALPLCLFLLGYLELSISLTALIQLVQPHLALAVDRWRKHNGGSARLWIVSVAELEALMSLASYRYEHPADPFPHIVATDATTPQRAVFEGTRLGHPLLSAAQMVPNDVHLTSGTQLLVVSGSNMSGKSTLLRTVGINAVLAQAGAPVRAAALRLSPLAIGATLRIEDSLQEGRSRFYAEITRIRAIADLAAGPVPLLFLLDELFHGTNSHDRLIGASGVLKTLLDRSAIGLITTHDLALTAVADRLSPRARNVHFEDWFEAQEMRFDYLVKPGPVTRSNAIALMRAVGLDLPPESSPL